MKRFQVISPIDGSVYAERTFADEPQIEVALQRAAKARSTWRSSTLAERYALCEAVVNDLLDRADDLGLELTWQMGRPLRYTPGEIRGGFQERARYMMNIAEEALTDLQAEPQAGFKRFVRRESLGCVLVLAPWNYPYLTAVNTIVPAIMAGNVVLLKHAEQTPLVAERLGEAFEAAGAPEGVFQWLHLTHEQVASVIRDSRIDHVAFTGSVTGGRAVQKALGDRFIGAGLELGGKDPAYVRADADLGRAVEALVDGAFFNSGQSCCAVERIYVHHDLFREFVERFVALSRTYVLGNPLHEATTLGPMMRTSAAAAVQEQIREAQAQGAHALLNPKDFAAHRDLSPYLAPQVLIKVNHHMRLMREETFGPVVGIMPVKNDTQALDLMNDSRYGLTASIWSQDEQAALALGDQLETGTVFLNRCDYLDPALAWTGVKDSGRGCTLSPIGYESLTRPKSFHLRR